MKKIFKLTHPKIKYARLVEGVRCDIKKYIKRESRKELPANASSWNFDCKFGSTIEDAKIIQVSDIGKCLNTVEEQKLESFYLEILAKPVTNSTTMD